MDNAFEKLKTEKKNNVDSLVKWMKDSKLIDDSKEAETRARKLFEDVKDTKDVELSKFKSAVAKLAEEQKKSVENFHKMLADEGNKLLDALKAGAEAGVSALKQALK